MNEINKEDTIKKWSALIDNMNLGDDKKSWLSDYAQKSMCPDNPGGPGHGTQSLPDNFPSILPMAMKVAAQTIGQDLVSVQPMGVTITEEMENEVKAINRERKIEAITDDKEFQEMKIQDHPDYKTPPSIKLCYLDFKYENE